MLEKRLREWVKKVLASYNDDRPEDEVSVNTYRMIVDVDEIISEEFGYDRVISENVVAVEQTYLELIKKLYEDVESDSGIPNDVRIEAKKTLASLRDILWDYSA